MNITMYECGFGDCFKLEDNNKIIDLANKIVNEGMPVIRIIK